MFYKMLISNHLKSGLGVIQILSLQLFQNMITVCVFSEPDNFSVLLFLPCPAVIVVSDQENNVFFGLLKDSKITYPNTNKMFKVFISGIVLR